LSQVIQIDGLMIDEGRFKKTLDTTSKGVGACSGSRNLNELWGRSADQLGKEEGVGSRAYLLGRDAAILTRLVLGLSFLVYFFFFFSGTVFRSQKSTVMVRSRRTLDTTSFDGFRMFMQTNDRCRIVKGIVQKRRASFTRLATAPNFRPKCESVRAERMHSIGSLEPDRSPHTSPHPWRRDYPRGL
jgi:hypothetical protein